MTVEHIKCFERLDLDFNTPRDGGDGWTILVGVNGVGKSTLLQSIVLGVLDPRPVTSLLPAPWRFYRSHATGQGRVDLTFDEATTGRIIPAEEDSYIEDDGPLSLVKLPLLLALSARRRIARPGELLKSQNQVLARVQGMFDTDFPLLQQDPFEVFDTDLQRREFAKVVRDVVTHETPDGARMFPLVDVVELRGAGGVLRNEQLLEGRRFELRYGTSYSVRVSVEELSDGYQAMLALILEILTQAALHQRAVPDPQKLEAIILIDEIEAHLHPQWQRTVVPLLRSVFPRCQFIVTTHSPLVVGSALAGEVHVLDVNEEDGSVQQSVLEERLAMLDSEQIYEEVFGVERMAPPDLVEQERDYLRQIAAPDHAVDPELATFVEQAWADAARAVSDDPA